jgi:hypothetical protein
VQDHAHNDPVNCQPVSIAVTQIIGRFEWDMTAANGWRLKMKTLDKPCETRRPIRTAGSRSAGFPWNSDK